MNTETSRMDVHTVTSAMRKRMTEMSPFLLSPHPDLLPLPIPQSFAGLVAKLAMYVHSAQ